MFADQSITANLNQRDFVSFQIYFDKGASTIAVASRLAVQLARVSHSRRALVKENLMKGTEALVIDLSLMDDPAQHHRNDERRHSCLLHTPANAFSVACRLEIRSLPIA